MQIAAISAGMLIALVCAFLLGAVFMERDQELAYSGPSASIPVVLPPDMPQAAPPTAPGQNKPGNKPAKNAENKPAPTFKKPVFPHMELQAQYAGPFADTVIQRWRDPVDGRICYTYIPANVKHAPQSPGGGFLDYGANSIGSISCVDGPVQRAGKGQAAGKGQGKSARNIPVAPPKR